MSIAAKAFLCASIVFQSTYAAVNRVITVEVAAEGAVSHRCGCPTMVKGSAGEPCDFPTQEKEYNQTELKKFHDEGETCLQEIVEHEVVLHHGLLTTYHTKLVAIHANAISFGFHEAGSHFGNHAKE